MRSGDVRLVVTPHDPGSNLPTEWSYQIEETHCGDNGGLEWGTCYADMPGFLLNGCGIESLKEALKMGGKALEAVMMARVDMAGVK
jgi:hypothetical protein